ncbi:unnamed protein product, partial [Acidithrix sp. C25]
VRLVVIVSLVTAGSTSEKFPIGERAALYIAIPISRSLMPLNISSTASGDDRSIASAIASTPYLFCISLVKSLRRLSRLATITRLRPRLASAYDHWAPNPWLPSHNQSPWSVSAIKAIQWVISFVL